MISKHSPAAVCTVGLSLSILTACAVGPNYHRPSAPVPPAFKEEQGWKPATPGEIQANQPWWSIYEDPVLDSLERQIEVSNQTLKADEAAYRSALEAVAIDRGELFPTIGVSGSVTRSSTGVNNINGNNTAIVTGGFQPGGSACFGHSHRAEADNL
jgi:outer membrane protein TolC